jgi:Zn-dependent protease
MSKKKGFDFSFSKQEVFDLIVSWLSLSLAFSVFSGGIFSIPNFLELFPIILAALGTGFIVHELSHRQASRHYGFHSEYRAWYPGLVFAFILALVTRGSFIFAAPGATYTFGNPSPKQNGIISAAGPLSNIIMGFLFLIIGFFILPGFLPFFFILSTINFWFATFNLIPIFPLDGSKVIAWNFGVWITMIAISAFFVFFF